MDRVSYRTSESRRAISLWFLTNGFVTASWVAHVPRVSADLGASPGALGLALLCMAMGAVVGMAVAPSLILRTGSGRSAWVAGLGYAMLLPLPLMADSLPALGLALLVFGAFHGMMDVTMNAAAAVTESALGRPVMAGFHGWFSVGMVAGVTGGVAALTSGLSPIGHAVVAVGLAITLMLSGRPQRQFTTTADALSRTPGRVNRQAVVLAGLGFICLFLEGAMADWSGLLAVTYGADAATASLAYAAFTATWAGGRFLGDHWTARFGSVSVVRMGGLLAAAGMGVALAGASPGWVTAGCGIVGLGLANTVPVLFRAAAVGDTSGRRLALVTGVGYFGFLVGPPLVGFTAEAVGLPRALVLAVIGGLVMTAGAAVLRPKGANDGDAAGPGRPESQVGAHSEGVRNRTDDRPIDPINGFTVRPCENPQTSVEQR